MRSLKQFIQTSERSECFLTRSFTYVSDKLEQLEFKLEKIIGI